MNLILYSEKLDCMYELFCTLQSKNSNLIKSPLHFRENRILPSTASVLTEGSTNMHISVLPPPGGHISQPQ